jgi:hypothetical protein
MMSLTARTPEDAATLCTLRVLPPPLTDGWAESCGSDESRHEVLYGSWLCVRHARPVDVGMSLSDHSDCGRLFCNIDVAWGAGGAVIRLNLPDNNDGYAVRRTPCFWGLLRTLLSV